LQLNLARPKASQGPRPAVLCIHGGGFRAGGLQLVVCKAGAT
jgi:acetyl esterase/lipase